MRNHIRTLREQRGLTQEQLGRLCNVSRQTINSLETGKFDPSIWLAHGLAKTFGTHIEQIFIFEEDTP